ncbi:hypothetical protein H9L21_06945 [Aeromicrobium senzhongii]|uniref:DUF2178 domain-containing protein n=1 Tax=Aeromicrobium senzhongii TaxID=2663859 RepID=A0ABX6SY14_9ACTN|nr:hypothetical protein [Aeromicrobium senzhongii]MTB87299.1 hypothetical protein [Aeromicrobium senzhongii]QNL95635.1 hypothetical protein H9L21_06945 [Aeromicrobium senzhongii]
MDVSTFYAVFSATCFALVGLWWGVTLRDTRWVAEPARRRAIGGVYLAFLLPALMGLFAQVGGVEEPLVWRISFIIISVVGCVATIRLLATDAKPAVTGIRAGAAAVYVLVALLGVFPASSDVLDLRPIQVEALLLVVLVALGHALAWHFVVHDAIEEDA